MNKKKLSDIWFKTDDKIRFFIIGCINAAISYIIFVFFILLLGESFRQLCVILQWGLSSIFSYINQKFFVFATRGNYVKEYLKCCSTWFVGYLLNTVFLEILIKYLHNVFVSQFVALLLVSVLTYVLFKYFAFKKNK